MMGYFGCLFLIFARNTLIFLVIIFALQIVIVPLRTDFFDFKNQNQVDFTSSLLNIAVVNLQATTKNTKGYIQFHQKDSRNFKDLDTKYELSQVRLMVFSGKPSEVGAYMGEVSSYQRNGYINVNLPQQGQYFVLVSVDWASDVTREIAISAYVDNEVLFEENNILFPENEDFLDECFLKVPPKKPGEEHVYKEDSEAFRFTNSCFGYFFFAYVNQSVSTTFKETITMNNLQHLKICPPYDNSNHWEVTVKPQTKIIVKYRLQPEGNGGYSYSFKSSTHFEISQNDLVNRILESQNKRPRKIQGEDQPVIFYNYFYNEGCAFYYKNDSDKIYCEQLKLTLTNLESEDGLNTQNFIEIQVDPGEGKLLKFKEIDENIRSSYKMAYAACYKE